jgi:glucose-1-phosphate thymidylyltransferase
VYRYDQRAPAFAAELERSERSEFETTDLKQRYREAGPLLLAKLGRGIAWLDTGTQESLMQAAASIETIENRQGLNIACPEEIAYRAGWIEARQVLAQAERLGENGYGTDRRRMLARG